MPGFSLEAAEGTAYGQNVQLVERDSELKVLAEALAVAAEGTGVGVAVVGEPGAGKSILVETACAQAPGLRVLRSRCDPLVTPRPLGPFRDLASHLGSLPVDGSLAEKCEAAYDALVTEPTVLIVEDLHWVDAASTDVLRFLLRRVEAMPVAVIVTYRGEEIGPRHSARPLLGDLATLDSVITLRLPPLSVDGVSAMLWGCGLDPEQVRSVTGGNPFFVSQVAKEPDLPLPDNVRDAVLARTGGIDGDDYEVLQLAAVAPDGLADRLLPAIGVDLPTLSRLHATGLLLRDRRGLVFRHELARLAVESTVPAGGLAHLHSTLLEALERIEPRDAAVLTHHAVAACDASRAARYAREAAAEAARTGSHTEAVAFLQTALRHLDSSHLSDRAELLTELAHEQFLTGWLEEAISTVSTTFAIWEQVDDPVGLAAAHASCSLFEYYNTRRRHAEAHADRAAELARPTYGPVFGAACINRAYLAVLRSEIGLAEQCCDDADRLAEEHPHAGLALRSRFVRAAIDLALELPGAHQRLVEVISEARDAGFDAMASTGYTNLGADLVEQRQLAAAEQALEEALEFSAARDIRICHHWQTGVRSRLRFLEGRWSAALEDATDAIQRRGMPLATLWPQLVSGLVKLRRDGSAGEHLDIAWRLAQDLDEPVRRLGVLSGLVERAWLTGVPDPRVPDIALAELQGAKDSPAAAWSAGELAVWLQRLGITGAVDPQRLAEPYRLSLSGRHAEAASWWRQAGASFDEAMAYTDSPDLVHRARGIERLDLLGAVAVGDRLRLLLRQEGAAQVPQRPQASTRANPAGLTNRQLDVAKLIARGFSNAEIAGRLFISPKTAEVHVSAVLNKLGVASRRAVVVRAQDFGLS